jgi:hypothetical protein
MLIPRQECLNPARATYANPVNSYSSDYQDGPQLYDYILHKTTGWNAIVINIFDVSVFYGFYCSVAYPNSGSGAFLTPGSGMGKKSGSGSGMNNQDHISESLKNFIWVKILKFFDVDPGWKKLKSRIRDGKKSDLGSGINIPDPHDCFIDLYLISGLTNKIIVI